MNQQQYWSTRYQAGQTGWDIGYPSTPIKTYIDQLRDKSLKILIPGAGNAYEAEYLWQQGYTNTHVLDIAPEPLAALHHRVPDIPMDQLIQGNFFEHEGEYDLILEQTFFCSFPPSDKNRNNYVRQMHHLLKPKGQLVGLWFDFPLDDKVGPPYGGDIVEYKKRFLPYFNILTLERCYNSIKPRAGRELFGIMRAIGN